MDDLPSVPLPSASLVTDGLTTTSDKIRALARAGYKRVEIGRILNIRYQHVRKVLLDAGIQGGLTYELERVPLELPVGLKQREETSSDVLLNGGFELLGEWRTTEAGEFELSAKAPRDAGVYAFVVEGIVRYVGLTQRGLSVRMGHYRYGHERQRTSARVKKLIVAALESGKAVQIFIAVPNGATQTWNGLPIDISAGLEAGMIRMIQPEWNMQGVTA